MASEMHPPLIGPFKGMNKEYKGISPNLYRVRFPKKLGLDSMLASWDLKIRIPRRKLRI